MATRSSRRFRLGLFLGFLILIYMWYIGSSICKVETQDQIFGPVTNMISQISPGPATCTDMQFNIVKILFYPTIGVMMLLKNTGIIPATMTSSATIITMIIHIFVWGILIYLLGFMGKRR